jgi:DNA polymerase-1
VVGYLSKPIISDNNASVKTTADKERKNGLINLIDVSGFIYRAFYAFPRFTHKDVEVGALYGFCSEMLKIASQFKGSMFAAAFDCGKKTFRNEIYPEYKANRKETPKEILSQIPLIKEACESFGFTSIERPGFEADDIIATCVKANSDRYKINIFSSDKDLLQLLDDNVAVYDSMKKKFVTEEDVVEKFGVPRDKVLDVLSLMGDSSDNIPGVSGIGPKTAASLINEFGSLENLISRVDSLPNNKKNETLKKEIDKAALSKRLASLRDDLDITLEYRISNLDNANEFLSKFGFNSLLR